MLRFRFTVRRMMIVVAIAGLICGATVLMGRRVEFLKRAEVAASRADDYATGRECLRPEYDRPGKLEILAARYASLAKKYKRAARYPWLPVAPDPPEPE